MKTTSEIYDDVRGRKKYIHLYGLLDREACAVAMKEYAKEAVQECVDIVRDHCNQSRERGMIADPATMILLLDNLKKEIQ